MPNTDTDETMTAEDVIRALCMAAQQSPEAFNSQSVKDALEAVDMQEAWDEASDDNEYTDEEKWEEVLNTICLAAQSGEPFSAKEFEEELDAEGVHEVWDEMLEGEDGEDEDEDEDEDGDGLNLDDTLDDSEEDEDDEDEDDDLDDIGL